MMTMNTKIRERFFYWLPAAIWAVGTIAVVVLGVWPA